MNAIGYLENQHREVETLFGKIEKLGENRGREKKALFLELARKLDHHAKIEERIFYPEGKEVDEDTTLEAYEEHDVVRSLIRKIKKTGPNDESFLARVTVLKEIVEHHVEEEEEEYFPKCEKAFGEEKLEELGTELEAAFDKLESQPSLVKHVKKAA